jgi:hypothetical protein
MEFVLNGELILWILGAYQPTGHDAYPRAADVFPENKSG